MSRLSPLELGGLVYRTIESVCQRCHSGPGFNGKSSFFAANPGSCMAGIETSLIRHRGNYAVFKRISWIFAGKWMVFLRIDGESGGEMREDFGILDARSVVFDSR